MKEKDNVTRETIANMKEKMLKLKKSVEWHQHLFHIICDEVVKKEVYSMLRITEYNYFVARHHYINNISETDYILFMKEGEENV